FKSNDRFYYNNTNDTQDSIVDLNLSNTQDSHKYQAFLTPFVTHTILDSSSMSGVAFGLVGGFNVRLGDTHTLGTHLGFSSGKVSGEQNNNSATIRNVLLSLGVHYKADFTYGMYLKALLDLIYLKNDGAYKLDGSINPIYASPQAKGYNLNLAFGKDFDFKSAGIFGLELGLESSGLDSKSYFAGANYLGSFTNIFYADLGVNY
ncbi:hypothetical protein CCY99_09270, partial [Helicobacter sp. 16-1353]|uniref:autotransporter domain-containing protein n=1 Tax=Helicobacter sp. 16-1353 TaxID=2004996 RepID=UPI000DCD27B9